MIKQHNQSLEPLPIDLPESTVVQARDLLRDLQSANVDRAQFDPAMNALLTEELLQSGASHIRAYGAPLTFIPVQIQTTAEGSAAIFRVTFATETLTWVVRVDSAGKVNGFELRHSPGNKVYSVFTRHIWGY